MASIYKRGKNWWIYYLVAGKSPAKSLETTSNRVALEKKQLEVLGGISSSEISMVGSASSLVAASTQLCDSFSLGRRGL
jgi:hypothetical protein